MEKIESNRVVAFNEDGSWAKVKRKDQLQLKDQYNVSAFRLSNKYKEKWLKQAKVNHDYHLSAQTIYVFSIAESPSCPYHSLIVDNEFGLCKTEQKSSTLMKQYKKQKALYLWSFFNSGICKELGIKMRQPFLSTDSLFVLEAGMSHKSASFFNVLYLESYFCNKSLNQEVLIFGKGMIEVQTKCSEPFFHNLIEHTCWLYFFVQNVCLSRTFSLQAQKATSFIECYHFNRDRSELSSVHLVPAVLNAVNAIFNEFDGEERNFYLAELTKRYMP